MRFSRTAIAGIVIGAVVIVLAVVLGIRKRAEAPQRQDKPPVEAPRAEESRREGQEAEPIPTPPEDVRTLPETAGELADLVLTSEVPQERLAAMERLMAQPPSTARDDAFKRILKDATDYESKTRATRELAKSTDKGLVEYLKKQFEEEPSQDVRAAILAARQELEDRLVVDKRAYFEVSFGISNDTPPSVGGRITLDLRGKCMIHEGTVSFEIGVKGDAKMDPEQLLGDVVPPAWRGEMKVGQEHTAQRSFILRSAGSYLLIGTVWMQGPDDRIKSVTKTLRLTLRADGYLVEEQK